MRFFFSIGIWLNYKVVLLLGVQQNESIIHIYIAILFFPYRVFTDYCVDFPDHVTYLFYI